MRSVASSAPESLLGASAQKPPATDVELTPEIIARRTKQRRQTLDAVGVSYIIDAAILLIYAYAGTTTFMIAPAFALTGLVSVVFFIVVFENRLNDRFLDKNLVLPQALSGLGIILTFLYVAPEVGCVFLCTLFLVFAFGSLHASPRQTVIAWTAMAIGLALLFLGTDKPIQMPYATNLERIATMLVFTLTIGRCMFIGIFSRSMRDALYKRGLELKEAYKRIEELAELDELTGSFNRRSIMQALDEEIASAQRNKMPCAVVLIDLDWFKRINDQFGHPAGDEALRAFAITMFANIRSIDKFGRYGGEEFLLILPEISEGAALRTTDRLRLIVGDLDWSAISQEMRVTMSAGLAMLQPDDTADSILARADQLLYQAKALGRNTVVTA